jgi:molybdopterin molybdotransferase
MAVLASSGRGTVAVAALPRIAVISTGDELVDVDEPLAPYQIRSSNDRAIEASLTLHRLARVTRSHLRDESAALREAIARLDADSDALVLSGGVSMGQFDLVPAVLAELGARLVFHKIRQRPGKPMWFGSSARGKPIFALPGNPVSTLVCATRYIVPALRAAAGLAQPPPELVTLASAAEASAELTYFLPVQLTWSESGAALAAPRPTNTSGDFVALAGTDGFVELAAKRGEHAAGTVVRLFRW